MKLGWLWLVAVSFLTLGVTGCGPSAAEIYAKEQARIQAEQARQAQSAAIQAQNEARARRIEEAENAGDAAAKSGKKQEAVDFYVKALGETKPDSADDFRIRGKVVKTFPVEPAVPDEAMRHAVRGRAMFKRAATGDYKTAVDELRMAVTVAPWWGSGYSALAVAQESNRDFAGAIQSLKLYVATAPEGVDVKAIKNKLYELEVAMEDEQRIKALTGEWRDQYGRRFAVKVANGAKLMMSGNVGYPLSIETDINGDALKGFAVGAAYRYDYCSIPGETTTATGKIAADGKSIEVEFLASSYTTDKRWVGLCCGMYECTRVTLMEKKAAKLTLKKAPPAPANPQAAAR